MILACGKILFRPDVMSALERFLPGYVGECGKSHGCHRFTMAVQDKSAGELVVWEIWENDAARAEHLNERLAKDFLGKFGSAITSADIQVHDITAARSAAKTNGTANTGESVSKSNKAQVEEFYRLISAGEDERAVQILADDAVWQEVATSIPLTMSKQQVLQGFRSMRGLLVDGRYEFTPVGFLQEGNKVAVELESRAVTKAGKKYNNKYHLVWEFRGEKAHRVRGYCDRAHSIEVLVPSKD
jgi:ketosteroid isomerase-like protein/quinol monooxygenase YgiN